MRRTRPGGLLSRIVLASALVVGLCPAPAVAASAEGVPADEAAGAASAGGDVQLRPQSDPVLYLGANDSEETCSEYTVVEDSVDRVAWSGGWFVVPAGQTVTLSAGLAVTGDVSLILCDGATLVIGGDIQGEVATPGSDDYSLAVYAQSHGDFAGKMVVGAGQEWDRGIRMDHLSIYGGNVTSVAGWHNHGIKAGTLTVDGGDVTASSTSEEHAGVFAANSMYLVRGSVKGTNENHTGIASTGYLIVNGADVEATGGTYGMHAASADYSLDVLSGSVTCQGGTAAIATAGDLHVNEGMMAYAGADEKSAAYVEDTSTWGHTEKWAHIGPHEHGGRIFSVWGWTDRLPVESGNYVLTDDVTLDGAWEIPAGADICLCLGDKTINLAGADARIVCGDTTAGEARRLTVVDDGGEGSIVCDPAVRRTEPIVAVGSGGAFAMEGGRLTGSTGGAVNVGDGGTFLMRGGEISGNTSTYQGAVWIYQGGTCDMSGGVISGNEGPKGIGCGVTVIGKGPDDPAGVLRVSGNAQIWDNHESKTGRDSNVLVDAGSDGRGGSRAENNARIVVAGELSEQARVGVWMTVPDVFTSGWGEHMAGLEPGDYFASDDDAYTVETIGEELALVGEPAPVGSHEMYRLYNPYSGEHFYTASAYERDVLVGLGWHGEGVGWIAPDVSEVPVYRLYNQYAGDHHYTVSAFERDELVKKGWSDEGIGWHSASENGVPVYRQYNPYASAGTHNYTTSKYEAMALVELGWLYEGIGWYGL